ncbi:MAG TPA: aldo/keto reductase [Candidatus Saccharimonadaceae bacterium]|nr:aldo/keto reductase [Candidatus Saccharimonadaceae bacterium]
MGEVSTVTLQNGVTMPQLGLGVWRASDNDAEFAVKTAIQSGYRLIDTAMMYKNEAGVGRAIAESGVPREELFITTKVWNGDQGYESTLKAFLESTAKLGLDYLDLYLIHWPMPGRDTMLDTWRAMEELYTAGKVRAIGVCNFRPEDLDNLLAHGTVPPVINQVELHPDFAQHNVRDYCKAHNIAVESWGPIGGQNSVAELLGQPVFQELAKKYGKTPAQIAIRWHIQNGLVVIPKSVHEERIRENIDVFDFELSAEDLVEIAKLDSADNRHGPDPATMNHN